MLAALASGSGVILKPAPQTPATGRLSVECCLEAGVPPDLVAFLPVPEDDTGRRLITHPEVDAVVLTGAHDTARLFTSWDPERRIHAETSGKNALVVTATADLDAAVADLVDSAFGHGGQKCSAASLALVEASVYDGPDFLRRLADATMSLTVGSAADPATTVSALIGVPAGPLDRALRQLDDGESWLVPPEPLDDGHRLWRPAVRIGVRPGSWFHRTECFGPVLGVIRVADLEEAIAVQNAVDFGLTGGIHSLDPAEVERWTDRVEVGNAYVNRGTTGAIVRRQPFGGWKRSSVGPTAKAGGPNYVLTLGRWHSTDAIAVERARVSFAEAWSTEYSREHDPSGLRFESNVLRYRPLPGVILRAGDTVTDEEIEIARLAATTCGTVLEVSTPTPRAGSGSVTVESDDALAARLADSGAARVRLLAGGSNDLRLAAVDAGLAVDDNPIVDHGRIELLRWLREQSVTATTHRYGTVV
jgi:RHH-type proline utilization regulon transcriptional repressor/proline dehydrogenase/delta 1-pyrroline-5-carboxylate dehydrogenase